MAGKKCSNCGNKTFFDTPTGGACSKCGFTMTVPANEGKCGKGSKCLNCGNNTVFDNVCRTCGAKYKVVKK